MTKNKNNPNSKYWKQKADKEWSLKVRQVGHCEICGSTDRRLHAHHIISRTRLRFRHNLKNGCCICSYCHAFDANISPHQDSYGAEKFLKWLKSEQPDKWRWYEDNKEDKRPMDGTYKQKYEELI